MSGLELDAVDVIPSKPGHPLPSSSSRNKFYKTHKGLWWYMVGRVTQIVEVNVRERSQEEGDQFESTLRSHIWKDPVLPLNLSRRSVWMATWSVFILGCAGPWVAHGLPLAAVSGSALWLRLRPLLLPIPGSGHVGFWSCGAQAWLLHGMWDPPRSGIKPFMMKIIVSFQLPVFCPNPRASLFISQVLRL